VDSVHGGLHWDACMDRSDASLGRTSSWWEAVAHGDIFDECWIDTRLCVGGAEDMSEDELGLGVFETTFSALDPDGGLEIRLGIDGYSISLL